MKKIIVFISLLLYLFSFLPVAGAEEKVRVYVFVKDKEPISENVIKYLNALQEKHPNCFEIEKITVWSEEWKEDADKRKLADMVASYFDEEIIGAPYIVIGDAYTLDEYSEDFNEDIENAILKEFANDTYQDIVAKQKSKLEKHNKWQGTYAIAITSSVIIGLSSIVLFARKQNKKTTN